MNDSRPKVVVWISVGFSRLASAGTPPPATAILFVSCVDAYLDPLLEAMQAICRRNLHRVDVVVVRQGHIEAVEEGNGCGLSVCRAEHKLFQFWLALTCVCKSSGAM